MEEASLILSVTGIVIGLVIAGFAIVLQWLMFEKSSAQLLESTSVLAKLEGVALQLRETQQVQFQQVLDVVLRDRRKEADGASEGIEEIQERLGKLEQQEPAGIAELSEIKKTLQDVKAAVSKLREPEYVFPVETPFKGGLVTSPGVVLGTEFWEKVRQGAASEQPRGGLRLTPDKPVNTKDLI